MFDLDQFIADLRATLPEKSRQPMKEVVARAVSNPAALMRDRRAGQGGRPGAAQVA
jgi:hypothetical protein